MMVVKTWGDDEKDSVPKILQTDESEINPNIKEISRYISSQYNKELKHYKKKRDFKGQTTTKRAYLGALAFRASMRGIFRPDKIIRSAPPPVLLKEILS